MPLAPQPAKRAHREGSLVAQAVTEWVGDFKLDGLPDQAPDCELVLEHPDHGPVR